MPDRSEFSTGTCNAAQSAGWRSDGGDSAKRNSSLMLGMFRPELGKRVGKLALDVADSVFHDGPTAFKGKAKA